MKKLNMLRKLQEADQKNLDNARVNIEEGKFVTYYTKVAEGMEVRMAKRASKIEDLELNGDTRRFKKRYIAYAFLALMFIGAIMPADGVASGGGSSKVEATPQEKYENWLEDQFSSWDGSVHKVNEEIKDYMKNPKSFDMIETTYVSYTDSKRINFIEKTVSNHGYTPMEYDTLIIVDFTGTNSFGGTVRSEAIALLRYDGSVIILDI